jgi:hypothetical protein
MKLSSLDIGRKSIVILLMITVALIIIDSTIVKFVAFGNQEFSVQSNVALFITISIISVGISIFYLRLVNKGKSKNSYRNMMILKYSPIIVSVVQLSIISILTLICLQIVFFNRYAILLLQMEIYIIQLSAIFFLVFLIIPLVNWIRTGKNYIVILYAISFMLLASNILASLIYISYDFSFHSSYKRPYSIHMFLLNLPRADLAKSFGLVLDILLFISFVATWIATAFQLSQYSRRVGRMRYWTLMSIPLIYFLFPFETYFLNISHNFMIESPVTFSVVYVLLFSATKQVGSILFATVFITASSIINRPDLKNSLIMSAVGIAILFSSLDIDTLLYAVYPPFGLVTILLMPIAACLILNGILISARQLSVDAQLRKEFYKRAESQLNLLKTIGVTQMERQLLKNCKHLVERYSEFDKSDEYQQLEQEDIKLAIRDILTELQSKSKPRT